MIRITPAIGWFVGGIIALLLGGIMGYMGQWIKFGLLAMLSNLLIVIGLLENQRRTFAAGLKMLRRDGDSSADDSSACEEYPTAPAPIAVPSWAESRVLRNLLVFAAIVIPYNLFWPSVPAMLGFDPSSDGTALVVLLLVAWPLMGCSYPMLALVSFLFAGLTEVSAFLGQTFMPGLFAGESLSEEPMLYWVINFFGKWLVYAFVLVMVKMANRPIRNSHIDRDPGRNIS